MLSGQKIIILILVLVFLLPGGGVKAQETVEIDQLLVEIWPEYDRPSVLVIYRIVLSPEVSLPADMTLRIPGSAGEPFNVALQDVDGMLYNMEYRYQPGDEWSEISFSALSQVLQIEYYDQKLEKDEGLRHYEFHWTGDHPVNELVFRVQQPVNATDFQISPQMGDGFQRADGLLYFMHEAGQLPVGTPFKVQIDYSKADDMLSANLQPVQAVEPVPEQIVDEDSLRLKKILPWGLGVLGLLLIAGGAYWYWQLGRREAHGSKSRRRRSSAAPADEIMDAEGAALMVYCHRCGKQATPGDVYCRTCGTKLRTE